MGSAMSTTDRNRASSPSFALPQTSWRQIKRGDPLLPNGAKQVTDEWRRRTTSGTRWFWRVRRLFKPTRPTNRTSDGGSMRRILELRRRPSKKTSCWMRLCLICASRLLHWNAKKIIIFVKLFFFGHEKSRLEVRRLVLFSHFINK